MNLFIKNDFMHFFSSNDCVDVLGKYSECTFILFFYKKLNEKYIWNIYPIINVTSLTKKKCMKSFFEASPIYNVQINSCNWNTSWTITNNFGENYNKLASINWMIFVTCSREICITKKMDWRKICLEKKYTTVIKMWYSS